MSEEQREGPQLGELGLHEGKLLCYGCRWLSLERRRRTKTTWESALCCHPDFKTYLGMPIRHAWKTPEWCPVLKERERKAEERKVEEKKSEELSAIKKTLQDLEDIVECVVSIASRHSFTRDQMSEWLEKRKEWRRELEAAEKKLTVERDTALTSSQKAEETLRRARSFVKEYGCSGRCGGTCVVCQLAKVLGG